MEIKTFMLGVLIISTLSSLTTEAVKKTIIDKYNNIIAAVSSIIISAGVSAGYIIVNDISVDLKTIVAIIAVTFVSWLCAMLGYDKVMQTLSQIKTDNKK